jgi:hypothetical protein
MRRRDFDQYVKVTANQGAEKTDLPRVQRQFSPKPAFRFVHHGEQSLSAASSKCLQISPEMPEKQGFSALMESQIYEAFELCLPDIKHAF